MKAAGIIFSNIHDKSVAELTRTRTMAAVPFLGRYRLIDFALSAMVNADISNIGVITHSNYHSLMGHIGSGKDFDLARRSGGVRILPPNVTAFGGRAVPYTTRLEALIGIYPFIADIKEELIVLSDCNTVSGIDIRAMLEYHLSSGADITLAVSGGRHTGRESCTKYRTDSSGRVTDILDGGDGTELSAGLNIIVMESRLLASIVADSAIHGYTSFRRDILLRGMGKYRIQTYRCDGYCATIGSLSDYFSANMELVRDRAAMDELFCEEGQPVYTKRLGSPPTAYSRDCRITKSLVADGCSIRGQVENCVLFRGVTVGHGAVLKNCVVMQDTVIGEDSALDYVICDKKVHIRPGRRLAGARSAPFFIPKGKMI